jgi:hypothetical protein
MKKLMQEAIRRRICNERDCLPHEVTDWDVQEHMEKLAAHMVEEYWPHRDKPLER